MTDELYTELPESEQQNMYRGRIKEVEINQFATRLELEEMEEILKTATGRVRIDAEKEITKLRTQLGFGEARLRVLRGKLVPTAEVAEESPEAG